MRGYIVKNRWVFRSLYGLWPDAVLKLVSVGRKRGTS